MDSSSFYLGPDAAPDKYRLVQQFGAGGEAQLWRAVLTLAGEAEPVAVKVLRPELHDDFAALSQRWSEQAELLRFVRHPGVVGVREHFVGAPVHPAGAAATTPGRSLCLVMNWVEGHPLRDWVVLNPGRPGLVAALNHLAQLADVLDWLHSGQATPSGRAVVHGDLSPGNVMITNAGQAVLVDFGLMRLAAHHTQRPAFTPGYAAPEVRLAGEYTPAADRYGLGAVGYFLLTGEHPTSDPGRLRAGLAAVPIIGGGEPARLDALMQIFDLDPAQRPTGRQWVDVLRSGATTAARRYEEGVRATGPNAPGPGAAPPASTPTAPVQGAFAHATTTTVPPPRVRPPATAVSPPAPAPKRRGKLLAAAAVVLIALGVTAGVAVPRLLGGTTASAADQPSPAAAPTIAAPTTTTAPRSTSAAPVTLGSGGPTTAPVGSGAITYVADVDPIVGQWNRSGTVDVDGRTYTHSVWEADCTGGGLDPREFEYNLGRAYTSFATLLGVSDDVDSGAQYKVEAFRDGVPVGTWTVRRGTTEQVRFDVLGALTLKLTVSTITPQQLCNGGLTLADATLTS